MGHRQQLVRSGGAGADLRVGRQRRDALPLPAPAARLASRFVTTHRVSGPARPGHPSQGPGRLRPETERAEAVGRRRPAAPTAGPARAWHRHTRGAHAGARLARAARAARGRRGRSHCRRPAGPAGRPAELRNGLLAGPRAREATPGPRSRTAAAAWDHPPGPPARSRSRDPVARCYRQRGRRHCLRPAGPAGGPAGGRSRAAAGPLAVHPPHGLVCGRARARRPCQWPARQAYPQSKPAPLAAHHRRARTAAG
jgi:hypothetical protein